MLPHVVRFRFLFPVPARSRSLLRPELVVLVQLVVEVLVQVLVLFEVSELLFAETVAATLERPVRRLTGQHCHPQLGLWLLFERAIRLSPTTPPPTARSAPAYAAPWRPARACAAEWTTA